MSAPALPPSCTQVLQSPASNYRWCDLDKEGRGPRPVRQLGDPRAEVLPPLLGRGWRLLGEGGLGPTRDRGQQQRRGWDKAGPVIGIIYCKAVNGNFTFHSAMRLLDLGSPEHHGSIEGVDQSVVGWILGAAVPSAVVLLYCCCDVAG